MVAIDCLLTLFGIWWLYFNSSVEHALRDKNTAFQWGYGRLIIFGSAAAIGALVSINVATANLGFAISVALYLWELRYCQERLIAKDKLQSYCMLFVAVLVIGLGMLPHSVMTIGVLIVLAVIYRQYNPVDQ